MEWMQGWHKKFANQLIGGGINQVKKKFENIGSMENDEEKDERVIGPTAKGDGKCGDPDIEREAFLLNEKTPLSEPFECKRGIAMLLKIEG